MVSKSMLPSLLLKQLATKPRNQPFYSFRGGLWVPVSPHAPAGADSNNANLKDIRIITWNIDFMASEPRARMSSALEYLKTLVETIPRSTAIAIFLQEMVNSGSKHGYGANDLQQIRDATWVQEQFNLTDIDTTGWTNSYGQTMLVDRRLVISSVSRLPLVSEFSRDALFVDINLALEERRSLRLCNVHLDSLSGSMRPVQWKALASFLQKTDEGIEASIVAGDCNATQPRDRTEPQENGFKDSYLELGGLEDDIEGATWGFQSLDAARYGPQRLDKQAYWGELRVKSLEHIGAGVKIQDERARRELEEHGALSFVTDHYGLMGEYALNHPLRISTESCE